MHIDVVSIACTCLPADPACLVVAGESERLQQKKNARTTYMRKEIYRPVV